MKRSLELAEKLIHQSYLEKEEYMELLGSYQDKETVVCLGQEAARLREKYYGNKVYMRGLIEFTNFCKNNCYYCGIRRDNRKAERYRLTPETVLACCEEGYRLGFRTFVLQSGEDPALNDELLTGLIREMRRRWPDCAITLSLGERTEASYRALFEAGANRYLLRHETITPDHYRWLHPVRMSLDHRIECLHTLKKIGYQTGTGIMVGSPGQTVDDLVRDLLFIREFEPQMIGIGPFIPHRDTPFGHEPAGSVERTLTLLSILRLMRPAALIPSTTALATLSGDGRMRGILAGANVVMPNLSPPDERSKYNLYDGKAAFGAEAAEGLAALERELNEIGRHISWSRGDYQE